MTELNICQIRKDAARIIKERGKAKGRILQRANDGTSPVGSVCLLGAIGLAVGRLEPKNRFEDDEFYSDPRVIEVVKALNIPNTEDEWDWSALAYDFSDTNDLEDVVDLLLDGCK